VNAWRTLGTWSLVGRFAALGAVAGFAAWAVVFVADLAFHIGRPSAISLLLAIPRGAAFGVAFALILRAYWRRTERPDDVGARH